MDIIKKFIKIFLWSLGVSIAVRIMFGAYSVFGTVSLTVPFLCAILTGYVMSSSSVAGYIISSSLHLILTTAFYILADFAGFFRSLPAESAEAIQRFTSAAGANRDILYSIIFVMAVYFISFTIISSIISSVKMRKKAKLSDVIPEETCEEYISEQ